MISQRNYGREALAIGNYAMYRFVFMSRCMRDELRKMINSGTLIEHLIDVEKTVSAYMDNYRLGIIHSDEYRNSEQKEKLLHNRAEAEEERIGNKWICVKNPYDSEEYCMWSAAAQISEVV